MCLVLRALLVVCAIKFGLSIDLPCEFDYDSQSGYYCKVVNFTNDNQGAHVDHIIGDHIRERSTLSVIRVIMFDLTISYLPGNLTERFPHLKNLQVKKCGMKNLTRRHELHGLRRIYFGFNEIDHIPVNYFWHFCKLEILSLHGNRISSIPKKAFRDLQSLQRLSLNGNLLKEIHPNLFDNCKNLEFIDLDNNFLKIIDGSLFTNLTMLTNVYLQNNNIIFIGNDFLSTLPRLKVALFQGNKCINESLPKISIGSDRSPLEYIQSIFQEDCSPNLPTTTTTPRPTTTPPRKKPKHEAQKIYYFDNCEWQAPKGSRYF